MQSPSAAQANHPAHKASVSAPDLCVSGCKVGKPCRDCTRLARWISCLSMASLRPLRRVPLRMKELAETRTSAHLEGQPHLDKRW